MPTLTRAELQLAVDDFLAQLEVSASTRTSYRACLSTAIKHEALVSAETARVWAALPPAESTRRFRSSVVTRFLAWHQSTASTSLMDLVPATLPVLARETLRSYLRATSDPWDPSALSGWLMDHVQAADMLAVGYETFRQAVHEARPDVPMLPPYVPTTVPTRVRASMGLLMRLYRSARVVQALRWSNVDRRDAEWQVEDVQAGLPPGTVWHPPSYGVDTALRHLWHWYVQQINREPRPDDYVVVQAGGGSPSVLYIRQCRDVPHTELGRPLPILPPKRDTPIQHDSLADVEPWLDDDDDEEGDPFDGA